MRVILHCCVVAALVLAGAPVHALESFVLYDNFNATSINPVKWTGFEFVGLGTEANRSIDTAMGELRMTYRAFGNTTSNSGQTFSGFGLLLSKNTTAIKALQTQVEVLTAQATDCAGNSATTLSRAGLRGSFFNTGSPMSGGSATNDVHALLFLRRIPTDPSNDLRVLAQVFRCTNQLCSQVDSLKQADLGTATTGQLIQLQIEWDQPNKRFLFQRGTNAKVAISYAPLSSTAAPSVALKALELAHSVENCTTTPRPVGFLDVVFDDVRVNQSASP